MNYANVEYEKDVFIFGIAKKNSLEWNDISWVWMKC